MSFADRLPRGLILKITLPTILLVLVGTIASTLALDWAMTAMHMRGARHRASSFAAAVEEIYSHATNDGHAAAKPFLQMICTAGEKSAWVTDAEGRVSFSSESSEPGRVLRPRAPGASTVDYGGARWLRWVRQVDGGQRCIQCHGNGRPIGYVAADMPLKHVEDEAREQREMSMLAGVLLALALSLVLMLMQYVLVYRPVRQLTAAVERIRTGDLTVRVPTRRSDEIGELAHSFNDMAASLERAKFELARTHRAELAQSEKLAGLGQLFSSIAHEIKNQLTGIIGALKVVEAESSEQDPNKPVLKKVLSQMEKLGKTTVQSLEFARPLKPSVAEVDLAELLDRALFFIERQATRQNVVLRKRYTAKLPKARADEELLKQVFLNLLLNGVQAMPLGGVLQVELRPAGALAIEAIVSDQGPGIPPDHRERIFSPFFSTKRNGTGLGLYIARQIVETQHGEILVESRPGEGTSFTVRLPAIGAAQEQVEYVASR